MRRLAWPAGPPWTYSTTILVAFGQVEGRAVVASGSNDRTVRVWDAASGDPVAAIGDIGRATSVAMDGSRIAWCSGPVAHASVLTAYGIVTDCMIDFDRQTKSIFIACPTLSIGAELGLVVIDLGVCGPAETS